MGAVSPAQRRALKARAHALEPVVLIGNAGVTPAVMAEVERALLAHELIKVRAGGLEREQRELAMAELCERTGAEAIAAIGKVMVLYRENPELRVKEQRAAAAVAAASRTATRSGRPGSRTASRRPGPAPKPAPRRSSRSGRARSGS